MNDDIQTRIKRIQEQEDPFSRAKLIFSLKKEKQVPLKTISAHIKLKPSYLSHILRLLKLPPLIVDGYYSKLVSISHLFILSRLHDEKQMIDLYEKILTEDLTSYQTEQLVREILYDVKNDGNRIEKKEVDEFIKLLESEGQKVRIIQTRTRGKFILEIEGNLIKTTTELKRVMELLKNLRLSEVG